MNKSEVLDLLRKIKHRYPAYQLPEDVDKLRTMIDDLHGDLEDVTIETASVNLREYVRNGKPFAPTIADLIKPLQDEQDRYFDSMRQAGREHLAKVAEMERTASPPPDEVRRIMSLPDAERWEELKAYAAERRKQNPAG